MSVKSKLVMTDKVEPRAFVDEDGDGLVILEFRVGENLARIELEPWVAGRLMGDIKIAVQEAQLARCTSPDSLESDVWPRMQDHESLEDRENLTQMFEAAQYLACRGVRPTPKLATEKSGRVPFA